MGNMGLKFSKLYPILRSTPRFGYIKVKIDGFDTSHLMIGGDPGIYKDFIVKDIETEEFDGCEVIHISEPLICYTVILYDNHCVKKSSNNEYIIFAQEWKAIVPVNGIKYIAHSKIERIYTNNIKININQSDLEDIGNFQCLSVSVFSDYIAFGSDIRPKIDISIDCEIKMDNQGNQEEIIMNIYRTNNAYNRNL